MFVSCLALIIDFPIKEILANKESADFGRYAEGNASTAVYATTTSTPSSRARKKKRRPNEQDEVEAALLAACQASSSTSAISDASSVEGSPAKRKKSVCFQVFANARLIFG
ncbi:unnamed protein product [Gongylonema pulchrum]|uniref:Secreted protein n=1 Tax=Gongylonema pulchrum TaxID=637853 RepID=A0A183DH83_9BILA|nr:unnamed protein product [Gongylonema pulchrum]